MNPLAGTRGRLASLFSTHPPIADRIARLLAIDVVRPALLPVPVATTRRTR